jgi:signal transduction histidine kinase
MDEPVPLPRLSRPIPEPVTDALVTAGAFALSLFLLSPGAAALATAGSGRIDVVAVVLVAASTVPLLVWRRAPVATFAVTVAATSVLAALGYAVGVPAGPTVALYLLAASRTAGRPWNPATTIVVLTGFAVFVAASLIGHHRAPVLEVFHAVLAWAVAWFAGERARLGRERLAELHRRAERAERDSERERRLAVAEERARLARDLHDSAGHSINVIAVRAGAARLRHQREPDRSLAALETIESIARQSAAEIDQIVGALRDPTGTDRTPHGLASLDTLVSQHTGSGLDVTVATTGRPRPLAPLVDQAAYRILQEALTNASRHGDGRVRVDVAFTERAIRLVVSNGVTGGTAEPPNGGHGLIGMRERAMLAGGMLETARINGSFRLQADLLYQGGPA